LLIGKINASIWYVSVGYTPVISRGMRWDGHVACMGKKLHTKFWLENLRERNHSKDLDVDEKIILQWILEK
jgi:hypothetical protein